MLYNFVLVLFLLFVLLIQSRRKGNHNSQSTILNSQLSVIIILNSPLSILNLNKNHALLLHSVHHYFERFAEADMADELRFFHC